jgi:hypothetical protein
VTSRNAALRSFSCLLMAGFVAVVQAQGHADESGKKEKKEKKEKVPKDAALVRISYATSPTVELPPGLQTVAVLDSQVADDTEKKWANIAANMIAGLVDEAARKYGVKLAVADRQNVARIMKEKDLAMAGITDGAKAAEAARLLNVQGMISSRITVNVEKYTGKGRTVTGANMLAWAREARNRERGGNVQAGGTGSRLKTEEIEKVSRNITVQCRFSLVDAATGKILVDLVSPPMQRTDRTRTRPFFGSSKTEAELTPRDEIIGEMVEDEVREFIGLFLPSQAENTIEVRPGKSEASKAGVRLLAAGDYDEAARKLQNALSTGRGAKDKLTVFALGVACEAAGKLNQAENYYRDAVVMDAPGAREAMQRLKTRLTYAASGPPASSRPADPGNRVSNPTTGPSAQGGAASSE